MDALIATTLPSLLDFMNRENITKEDVVQILSTKDGEFITILYK